MRVNLFAAAFVLAGSTVLSAQTPAPAAPAASTPAAPQKPADAKAPAPYKPDFVIAKPDGPAGAKKDDSSTGGAPGPGYVIGIQDNISITVTDETDLTGKFRVDSDGTITYPYLGRVPAAGITIGELQDRLSARLKDGFVRNPQVRVEIDQYKARSVYVTGEVRSPGRVTIQNTRLTLLEALALAGSPTANASNQIIVTHPGQEGPNGETARQLVNRKDLELGKSGSDVELHDGDIINVPVAQRFYITGMIRNPGFYVLDPGMTVDQAIALAGGMADRGSDRRITAKRVVNGKTQEVSVKIDDKVEANDTINIPSRFF